MVARGTRAGVPGEQIAVLYRSNGQSRLLEENLREQSVGHRVVGGTQFFERKEVKDLLAYLKLCLNPSDEISLRRVVNYPARGIGETTLERLVAEGIQKLPAIERTVLALYYQEELTLREIAEVVNLHESRISQLKSQAILRLRSHLENQWPASKGTVVG